MARPYWALQKAVYAALSAAGVCDGRIYDRVPRKPSYPYVTIGNDQFVDDGNACWDQTEVFCTIDVWDRADDNSSPGHHQAKAAASDIVTALNGEIAIDAPFNVAFGEHVGTLFPPQPEAVSTHAVLTFRYLIQN